MAVGPFSLSWGKKIEIEILTIRTPNGLLRHKIMRLKGDPLP